MAEIAPFRGILYNPDSVSGDNVIAPPYDVITPDMRTALYEKSPYNVVRIDFGMEMEGDDDKENKYSRAARLLEEWQKEGVLKRAERPAIYAYRMDYEIRGLEKSLTGFFALVKLVEPGKGVYPHEATYSKPKLDRLTLLQVTGANTSPIFSLYNSPHGETASILADAEKRPPFIKAKDREGNLHSVWPVEDAAQTAKICAELSDKAIYIADGHHRYETALENKKLSGGPGPSDYVLMFLANIADGDNLTVLPTHRLVNAVINGDTLKKISAHFDVKTLPPDADIIDSIRGVEHAMGMYSGGGKYALKYRGRDLGEVHPVLRKLDVVILHEMLIKKLLGVEEYAYEMDASLAKEKVDKGYYGAALFLNPTKLSEVENVALSMLRMPPKSTYFYPKVPTGLVINSLEGP